MFARLIVNRIVSLPLAIYQRVPNMDVYVSNHLCDHPIANLLLFYSLPTFREYFPLICL